MVLSKFGIQAQRRRAAAAVELAAVLPFVALMLAAAIDFGRVFYALQVLDVAAANAAAVASGSTWVDTTSTTTANAAVAAAVAQGASLHPPLTTSQVAVTIGSTSATATVAYTFPLLTGALLPGNVVQLQRTVTAPVLPTAGN